ncbi:MAG: peptidylprolyl isomerase [Candidatus Hydrogenedentes bacterium]|nr:peptidylprolyl isomerase [Candidatus Hydrogenedentota bacterium]
MIIEDARVVSIHYTLTDEDGEEIDSSIGQDPLVYLHGASNIIPGLEKELTGKKAGDKLKVIVQPEDGYGEMDPELIQVVDRDAFEGVEDLEEGMEFQAQGEDGHVQRITIMDVDGDEITINGNHPLAGQVLHFDVSIEAVREATPDEVAHGHIHGDGCHHHH